MEMTVEKAHILEIGNDWIRAIRERDFNRLRRYCQPDIDCQLIIQGRQDTIYQAGDLVARYQKWFGECDPIYSEQTRVDLVGERLEIFYRLLLLERGNWYTIEQQLFLTFVDSLAEKLQLLCSGFHPVDVREESILSQELLPHEVETPLRRLPDARLEVDAGAGMVGSICAVLTPAIKAKLRELESGQLLEVRVSDPSAQGDIESWSRLSGNQLLEMSVEEGQELRFLLQKK